MKHVPTLEHEFNSYKIYLFYYTFIIFISIKLIYLTQMTLTPFLLLNSHLLTDIKNFIRLAIFLDHFMTIVFLHFQLDVLHKVSVLLSLSRVLDVRHRRFLDHIIMIFFSLWMS